MTTCSESGATSGAKAEQWRAAWAEYTNKALEQTGRPERIDHRSYQRQGVEQIPTVHMGVAATRMEQRGIATDKGNVNRQIAADNKLLKEIMGIVGLAAAEGLILAIGLIVGLIVTIICGFVGHIILFDSIFFAIISGILANKLLHIHPALSLIIGIAVLLFLFWVQNTKFGFWIVGGVLSFFWAFVFCFFAYTFSNKDMIWTYVILGLGFIIMMFLHIHARDK